MGRSRRPRGTPRRSSASRRSSAAPRRRACRCRRAARWRAPPLRRRAARPPRQPGLHRRLRAGGGMKESGHGRQKGSRPRTTCRRCAPRSSSTGAVGPGCRAHAVARPVSRSPNDVLALGLSGLGERSREPATHTPLPVEDEPVAPCAPCTVVGLGSGLPLGSPRTDRERRHRPHDAIGPIQSRSRVRARRSTPSGVPAPRRNASTTPSKRSAGCRPR